MFQPSRNVKNVKTSSSNLLFLLFPKFQIYNDGDDESKLTSRYLLQGLVRRRSRWSAAAASPAATAVRRDHCLGSHDVHPVGPPAWRGWGISSRHSRNGRLLSTQRCQATHTTATASRIPTAGAKSRIQAERTTWVCDLINYLDLNLGRTGR